MITIWSSVNDPKLIFVFEINNQLNINWDSSIYAVEQNAVLQISLIKYYLWSKKHSMLFLHYFVTVVSEYFNFVSVKIQWRISWRQMVSQPAILTLMQNFVKAPNRRVHLRALHESDRICLTHMNRDGGDKYEVAIQFGPTSVPVRLSIKTAVGQHSKRKRISVLQMKSSSRTTKMFQIAG